VQLTQNPYYFGLLHLGFVTLTILVIGAIQIVPVKIWKKMTWLGALILLVTLVLVFFFQSENGAHRWIPLGQTGFNIQPSEFAKIIVILLGALLFSTAKLNEDKKYSDHLLRLLSCQFLWHVLYLFWCSPT
jgi:cell division protein FtsW (lipid II flippase)